MTKSIDERELVLDILLEILERNGYSHVVLHQALAKYQYLQKQERAFISRVTNGTLEYLIQIDYMINTCSKIKVNKMKPLIRTLLRMSVYQIYYMDRIPDSAVCNEAVQLADKRIFRGLKGFVNGVLRTIVRKKKEFTWPDDAVRYSVPEWLITQWKNTYEDAIVKEMLKSFLEDSKTTVRCNLGMANKATILESLKTQKITVLESEYADSILYLKDYDYLDGIDAFQKGYLQVQDISSYFVGEIASPKEGSYVIDVCGAPGGKSLHLADRLHGTGMIEVRDITDNKIQMVKENIERCGFKNIRTKVQDARILDVESIAQADIVLADLPCSGLGIIGKKPDIKYNMTPEKLESLAELQREILSVVSQYVKPGGRLIYSTCTIDTKENEENTKWFLEQFPFEAVDLEGKLGNINEVTMKEGYLQLLPGIHPCDGFFIAAFQRKIG